MIKDVTRFSLTGAAPSLGAPRGKARAPRRQAKNALRYPFFAHRRGPQPGCPPREGSCAAPPSEKRSTLSCVRLGEGGRSRLVTLKNIWRRILNIIWRSMWHANGPANHHDSHIDR